MLYEPIASVPAAMNRLNPIVDGTAETSWEEFEMRLALVSKAPDKGSELLEENLRLVSVRAL